VVQIASDGLHPNPTDSNDEVVAAMLNGQIN